MSHGLLRRHSPMSATVRSAVERSVRRGSGFLKSTWPAEVDVRSQGTDADSRHIIAGIMRAHPICGMVFCACVFAQGVRQPSSAAEDASHLMAEADKLADQHTGKAMEDAIADYRQAAPLWHDLQQPQQEARALDQIGVLSLRMGNLQPALENLTA